MKMLTTYPLFQQAYLVNDLEAACHNWSKLFGAGPFVLAPHHVTDRFTYRGTPQEADVSYAFGYLGDMMIQFIEQHDETPSIYRTCTRAARRASTTSACWSTTSMPK